MKKLRLDMDDVKVESFLTSGKGERTETVRGYQESRYTDWDWSCAYPGCPTVFYGSCPCPPAFE
jgi:hypothetical protein